MRITTVFVAALLAASALPAQAALYKCKENGRTVYSDRGCASPQGAPRQLPQASRKDPLNAQNAAAAQAAAESATPALAEQPAAEAAEPAESASAGTTTSEPAPAAVAPLRGAGVPLLDGKVVLRLNSSFRFLDANRAQQVLVQSWGNPPETAEGVLGMIVPADFGADDPEGWGVVITYTDDGYVSDEDAGEIDYNDLLRDMQQESAAENEARAAQGYEPVTLVGWAEPPHYDAATHKMYWAKDLAFGEGPEQERTLNYAIRVLGREGVLELNAVAETSQLASIKRQMEDVVGFAEFSDGNRYADYNESTDRRAAYGIAALVAGGLAAKKLGLLALIAALAVKFWKLAAIGAVALLGLFKAAGKKR